MFLFVSVTCALFVFVSVEGCLTPNNETAECIPIDSCPVIKRAIAYLNPEAVKFAQESQCGFDGGPLVCCGSAGRLTTPAPPIEKFTPRPNIILDLSPATPIENHLLPDLTLCGLQIVNGRQGGHMAGKEEHPWLVALMYTKDTDEPSEFKCSAVLINNYYVVTAAECVEVNGYTLASARLGGGDCSSKTEHLNNQDQHSNTVVNVKIIEKIVHPYYSKRKGSNNIAILRFDQKVPFTDSIRPICLPPNDFPSPVTGSIMEASGWSLTKDGSRCEEKLKANITLLEYAECAKTVANYTRSYYPGRICARNTDNSRWCNGESGIPLITRYTKPKNALEDLDEQWYLEGLITKGFGCNGNEVPSLYMRISRYVTWIINNIH